MTDKTAPTAAENLKQALAAKKARTQGGAGQGFGGAAGGQPAAGAEERSVAARNMALAKPAFRKASKRG